MAKRRKLYWENAHREISKLNESLNSALPCRITEKPVNNGLKSARVKITSGGTRSLGAGHNTVVTINGRSFNGITKVSYEVGVGELAVVKIEMLAKIELDVTTRLAVSEIENGTLLATDTSEIF